MTPTGAWPVGVPVARPSSGRRSPGRAGLSPATARTAQHDRPLHDHRLAVVPDQRPAVGHRSQRIDLRSHIIGIEKAEIASGTANNARPRRRRQHRRAPLRGQQHGSTWSALGERVTPKNSVDDDRRAHPHSISPHSSAPVNRPVRPSGTRNSMPRAPPVRRSRARDFSRRARRQRRGEHEKARERRKQDEVEADQPQHRDDRGGQHEHEQAVGEARPGSAIRSRQPAASQSNPALAGRSSAKRDLTGSGGTTGGPWSWAPPQHDDPAAL